MPSLIEWLSGGETWNFIDAVNIETQKVGHYCEKISPECARCYAEKLNKNTFFGNGIRYAVDQRGKVRISLNESKLQKPLHWKKPRLVFPCSMTDLFGEWVLDAWIDAAYDVMEKASQHTYLVLTKRPDRRLEYLRKRYTDRKPAPNIWEGVSCGLQKTADEFIPLLLQTPAPVRWLSIEPLLAPITFRWARWDHHQPHPRRVSQLPDVDRGGKIIAGCVDQLDGLRMLDWVVAGGESGPGARPMHPDWARSLRDQCKTAGVPFFFKQWGEWMPVFHGINPSANDPKCRIHDGFTFPAQPGDPGQDGRPIGQHMWKVGKKAAGRKLDGVEHNEYPEVAR